VRRTAWERIGGFDEALPTSEDFDWILRARAAGLATAFVPAARVEHLPARPDRAALLAHATWYGRHFNDFRRKHPGLLDRGPSWRSRTRLQRTAALKSIVAALGIFRGIARSVAACELFPVSSPSSARGYQAIVDTWPAEPSR
jgi:GT2 family glycosyltransferase